MKLIHKFKSPNFNDRKSSRINFIIIHYTAIDTIMDSINFLCEKRNKVSSHYVISKSGKIYNLVSENKRAWHAGKSYWGGITDINSSSIGIELDYPASSKNQKFSNELIISLMSLLKKIVKKYQISSNNVLGHSDIAPYRKIDPGKNFPWYKIEKKQLSFDVKKIKKKTFLKHILKKWYLKNKFNSQKKIILFMLNYIGYDISLAIKNNLRFNQLILNYSNHFKFYKNNYYNNKYIFKVIELHFLNILLTKLKK